MDADDALSSLTAGFGQAASQRPPLLGRGTEFKKLKFVWERVSSSGGRPSEAVTVRGPSGVGKSYLIESFRPTVEGTNQGIFVSSKFDQLAFKRSTRREPFYAVVSAFSDICEILKAKESALEIGEKIRKAVGVEFSLLCQFIPTLHRLRSTPNQGGTVSEAQKEEDFRWDTSVNKDDSLARIRWALKTFLRAAASSNPIFLHFDDIHWADTESLTLLQAIITDSESKSVVTALSYRDGDESLRVVSGMLGLRRTTRTNLKTTSPPSGPVRMTELLLRDLSKNAVKELILAFLRLDRMAANQGGSSSFPSGPEDLCEDEIVDLVFVKTSGNPFFVLQYLEKLKLDGLLHYSAEDDRWNWSDVEAMTRLDVTEGVLGSIEARMSQLPVHVRRALTIAAHLGFRFRRDVLETVLVEEYMDSCEDSSSLKQMVSTVLDSSERASLLLRVDKGESYCFMHDRIQQCAYEMVAQGNSKRELYLNLGTRILPMLEKDDSLYYLVADLLNNGSDMIVEKEKRSELVEINKTAAEMSIGRAAYGSATHYLRCAIDFLDFELMWKDSYDLSLSLHDALAVASCNSSEYDVCHRTAETIVRNARCVSDKHTATLASIHAYALDGKSDESIRKGLQALRELGVSIRMKPSKVGLLLRILRTRRSLMSTSKLRMLSLPKMTDPKKLAIFDIIGEMIASVFIVSNENLLLHLYELMMSSSLRGGWSTSTMVATSSFGLVEIAAFGDVKRAAELGTLALDMAPRYGTEEYKCPVLLMVYTFVFPWTRRWRDCFKNLSDGFSSGLQHGKTYLALTCLSVMSGLARITESLTDAERIIKTNFETMKRFKVSSSLLPPVKMCFQFVQNMKGCVDNPMRLHGDLMDDGDPLCSNDPVTEAAMHLLQLELASHFGALDRARHVLQSLEREIDRYKPYCPYMVLFWFWSGMTYLDLAREGKPKQRKNLKRAKDCLACLQNVISDGCDDARPFCQILKADLSSFNSSSEDKVDVYDLAIEAAVENGLAGYAGLACERAYLCLVRLDGSTNGKASRQYWNQMMDFYDQWGAVAKIDWLIRTHGREHAGRDREEVPDVVVRHYPSG